MKNAKIHRFLKNKKYAGKAVVYRLSEFVKSNKTDRAYEYVFVGEYKIPEANVNCIQIYPCDPVGNILEWDILHSSNSLSFEKALKEIGYEYVP